jgi:hypothetical protein
LVFFSPRAVPGIQIDENREKKEKTGRDRKQRIKNEYRAAPRRFRVPWMELAWSAHAGEWSALP